MAEHNQMIHIEASPETVIELLLSPSQRQQWIRDLAQPAETASRPTQAGASWQEWFYIEEDRVPVKQTLTQLEGHTLTLVSEGPGFTKEARYLIAQQTNGVDLHINQSIHYHGFLPRLMGFFLGRTQNAVLHHNLRQLKALAESQSKAA